MKTYRVEAQNMPKLVTRLRPLMIADPAFRTECERCMSVCKDHVLIYIDTNVSPALHKAAIELGA